MGHQMFGLEHAGGSYIALIPQLASLTLSSKYTRKTEINLSLFPTYESTTSVQHKTVPMYVTVMVNYRISITFLAIFLCINDSYVINAVTLKTKINLIYN